MRVRSITLFIFGGVSSTAAEMPSAREEFRIAIAGPLMSVVLGLVFGSIWLATRSLGVAPVFGYLALINLALGVFNLLPGFPLDGGRVFRALLWARTGNQERATTIAGHAGSAIGLTLIAFGVVSVFLVGFLPGIWYALIGSFLFSASRGAGELLKVNQILETTEVARLMRTPPPTIDATATVSELVDTQTQRGERAEIVESAHRPVSVVTVTDIAGRPRSTWDQVRVEQIMVPESQLITINSDRSLRAAIGLMGERGVRQLPVVSDAGRIVGIVTLDDVERFVKTRAELDHAGGNASS
jgi:CBS domain-containing protein